MTHDKRNATWAPVEPQLQVQFLALDVKCTSAPRGAHEAPRGSRGAPRVSGAVVYETRASACPSRAGPPCGAPLDAQLPAPTCDTHSYTTSTFDKQLQRASSRGARQRACSSASRVLRVAMGTHFGDRAHRVRARAHVKSACRAMASPRAALRCDARCGVAGSSRSELGNPELQLRLNWPPCGIPLMAFSCEVCEDARDRCAVQHANKHVLSAPHSSVASVLMFPVALQHDAVDCLASAQWRRGRTVRRRHLFVPRANDRQARLWHAHVLCSLDRAKPPPVWLHRMCAMREPALPALHTPASTLMV